MEGPAQGDVDDVILIPGLATSREVWDATRAAQRSCVRLHVIQIRGFGDAAEANGEGPVLEPFVRELGDYIADRIMAGGGKKPLIVGHSLGGLSGLMIAARYPDLVRKVMVVDALPFIGTLFHPAATVDLVRPQAERLAASIRSAYGQPKPVDTGRDPGPQSQAGGLTNNPRGRMTVDRWSRNSDPRVIAQALLDVMTTDMRPELSKISAPVTLLYAQDDSAMTVEQSTAAFLPQYSGTPNFKATQIRGSYHFIMLDQPEKFAKALADFIAGAP
ncbi:alpha/beta hydrolase [Sphingorhabdus lacus]|uniref:Alpha/beta hydrolase n=1 Tax=Sphingorhabdus lacus TaxID=392610 RepID=A0A6I6LIQ9_9SPHN|nr:alpha/beta hydrolase [Sphingorhabdus lacus]